MIIHQTVEIDRETGWVTVTTQQGVPTYGSTKTIEKIRIEDYERREREEAAMREEERQHRADAWRSFWLGLGFKPARY